MTTQSNVYLGLMSGSSCDGFDIAVMDFSQGIRVVLKQSHAYETELQQQLLKLVQSRHVDVVALAQIEMQLMHLYADAINGIDRNVRQRISAMGLHGPTLRHEPNLSPSFTWQLGNAVTLAEKTGLKVVHQFRQSDMVFAAQGAPLTPIFHHYLAAQQFADTCCLFINLGGISNISLCAEDQLIGFDTGPANTLLDQWVQRYELHPSGYDADGNIAATGRISEPHLQACLRHPFLQRNYPKSTGREEFNLHWLHQCWLNLAPINHADVLATLTQFSSSSLVLGIEQVLASQPKREAIIGVMVGGGVANRELTKRIKITCKQRLSDRDLPICTHIDWRSDLMVDTQYIEAAAWAYLAYLNEQRRGVDLRQVTGNQRAHCVLGQSVIPNNHLAN